DIVEHAYAGPVLYLAGNHDLGEPLAQVLGAASSLTLDDWEVITFDSHVDNRTEAGFDDVEQRELLRRIDASTARHLLLFCHHHPLPVGCPWLDKDRVPRGAAL